MDAQVNRSTPQFVSNQSEISNNNDIKSSFKAIQQVSNQDISKLLEKLQSQQKMPNKSIESRNAKQPSMAEQTTANAPATTDTSDIDAKNTIRELKALQSNNRDTKPLAPLLQKLGLQQPGDDVQPFFDIENVKLSGYEDTDGSCELVFTGKSLEECLEATKVIWDKITRDGSNITYNKSTGEVTIEGKKFYLTPLNDIDHNIIDSNTSAANSQSTQTLNFSTNSSAVADLNLNTRTHEPVQLAGQHGNMELQGLQTVPSLTVKSFNHQEPQNAINILNQNHSMDDVAHPSSLETVHTETQSIQTLNLTPVEIQAEISETKNLKFNSLQNKPPQPLSDSLAEQQSVPLNLQTRQNNVSTKHPNLNLSNFDSSLLEAKTVKTRASQTNNSIQKEIGKLGDSFQNLTALLSNLNLGSKPTPTTLSSDGLNFNSDSGDLDFTSLLNELKNAISLFSGEASASQKFSSSSVPGHSINILEHTDNTENLGKQHSIEGESNSQIEEGNNIGTSNNDSGPNGASTMPGEEGLQGTPGSSPASSSSIDSENTSQENIKAIIDETINSGEKTKELPKGEKETLEKNVQEIIKGNNITDENEIKQIVQAETAKVTINSTIFEFVTEKLLPEINDKLGKEENKLISISDIQKTTTKAATQGEATKPISQTELTENILNAIIQKPANKGLTGEAVAEKLKAILNRLNTRENINKTGNRISGYVNELNSLNNALVKALSANKGVGFLSNISHNLDEVMKKFKINQVKDKN